MNIISYSFDKISVLFEGMHSLVEMFHNTVVFLSYIFVVFSLNFFFIFLSVRFHSYYSLYLSVETRFKNILINNIMYWGSHREKLSNYLLYVFFMDAAKINIFISIFHFFFLCYFSYLLYFTNMFVVQSDFVYFYSVLLCIFNFIFLVFRHLFFNRLLYWLFVIFFGMFNWFLFFSFVFVDLQLYDFVSFKWFIFQKQVDVSDLQELLNKLCVRYLGYLFYNDSSLFLLHTRYDVQLFFWSNFYDMFHTNPFHYYFVLYLPSMRVYLIIMLGIFFHVFLVLFFNFLIYFVFYCYTLLFVYKRSYKEIYQIFSLFFAKIYYFYLGYVLLFFYFIFFFSLLYLLFTSFTVHNVDRYTYFSVVASVQNLLVPLFRKIGTRYYNSVMSTLGSSNYEFNNGKCVSLVTNTSLEKGEDYQLVKLPKHVSVEIKKHGFGNYDYLIFRKNNLTQKLEAVFVKMDMPAHLSCSFPRRNLLMPEKMYGLPNEVAMTKDVYSSVSPQVSTKVDGHPLLVVSALSFECDLSKYDILVLSQPGLDLDRYVTLFNRMVQGTFTDRSLAVRTGCVHFCSTNKKALPYDLSTEYEMSLLSFISRKDGGSPQLVSRHGSNIPHNHVVFNEQNTDTLLSFLLENDPIAGFMLVEKIFTSVRANYIHAVNDKKVLSDSDVEKELFRLEKEYGVLDSSKLKFIVSDISKLSTPGYVGLSELSTILSSEQMRVTSEVAMHQAKTYLCAKYSM